MRRLGLLLSLALLAGSCSLTRPGRDACESHADCRGAFGFGFACGDEGFCRAVEPHPRCPTTFPADLTSPAFADALVVGSVIDGSVETHLARQRAVRLAFTEVRDLGGLDGREVGLVFCTNEVDPRIDDLSQTEATAEVARYLEDELGVPVILGPPSSDATRAAFEATDEVLLISPSASSSTLTALEGDATDADPGRLWRTVAPDALQARVIADDLEMRGVSRVAVIAQDGAYGTGLADELEAAFGGEVERFGYDSASTRNAAATDAGASGAEEVLFFGSQTSDVVAFVLFADSFAGYADKEIFLSDSAANRDFLTGASAASGLFDRIRGTRPAAPEGIVFDAFVSAYAAENMGANAEQFSFTAHAYDAAWIALLGATWAQLQEGGALTPETIARGMRMTSAGPPFDLRISSYADITERFRLGESVDVRGASGDLDFDPVSEETRAPVEVWRVAAGGGDIEGLYVVTP